MSLARLDAGLEEVERSLAARDTSLWAGLAQRVIDDCHPEQRAFALDPGRRVVGLVGRGGGKTTGGRARLVKRLLTTPGARCVYIATTREHAERLMWRPLKALFAELGFETGKDVVYNETKLLLTLPRTGAQLQLAGADKAKDIDRLRGLSYHEVGIDEAASHTDKILRELIEQVVGPRLGEFRGCIWLIGTPGRVLKGLFYDVSRLGADARVSRPWVKRDERPEWESSAWKAWSLHEWTLASAIEASKDRPIQALIDQLAEHYIEKAAQGWSDENPIWRREYLGKWAADDTINIFRYRIHDAAGRPWNQWDPERVGPLRIAKLPDAFADWVHVVSLDLGHTDPTSFNVFAFSPSDPTRTIYHRLCFEQTQLYAQLIAFRLIGEDLDHEKPGGIIGALGEWPNGMVADSAHQMAQAILDELQKVYGITIEPAQKGFGYKLGAIEVVNGDFVDGRIKILKGSELEAQLLALQWIENRAGEMVERKDQPNHSTDGLIYGRMLIGTMITAGRAAAEERPRSPHDEPPLPNAEPRGEFAGLFEDDYAALMG